MSKKKETQTWKFKRLRASLVKGVTRATCHYCKRSLLRHEITIDHKIAVSRGGPAFDTNNLAFSCLKCNHTKGNMSEAEFLKSPNRPKVWRF